MARWFQPACGLDIEPGAEAAPDEEPSEASTSAELGFTVSIYDRIPVRDFAVAEDGPASRPSRIDTWSTEH